MQTLPRGVGNGEETIRGSRGKWAGEALLARSDRVWEFLITRGSDRDGEGFLLLVRRSVAAVDLRFCLVRGGLSLGFVSVFRTWSGRNGGAGAGGQRC